MSAGNSLLREHECGLLMANMDEVTTRHGLLALPKKPANLEWQPLFRFTNTSMATAMAISDTQGYGSFGRLSMVPGFFLGSLIVQPLAGNHQNSFTQGRIDDLYLPSGIKEVIIKEASQVLYLLVL